MRALQCEYEAYKNAPCARGHTRDRGCRRPHMREAGRSRTRHTRDVRAVDAHSVSACCSSLIRRPMASHGAAVVSVTSARVSVDGHPEQARSGLALADVELA